MATLQFGKFDMPRQILFSGMICSATAGAYMLYVAVSADPFDAPPKNRAQERSAHNRNVADLEGGNVCLASTRSRWSSARPVIEWHIADAPLVTNSAGSSIAISTATVAARRADSTTGDAILRAAGPVLPLAIPATNPARGEAIAGSEVAGIDDDFRYIPTTRPSTPRPQHPPPATQGNVDTDKPVHEWQRATDDWFGVRPKLDDAGITFQPSLMLLFGHNFKGGATTAGIDSGYLFNLNVTLDTEKLAGWKGGTFFTNFRRQEGAGGTQDGAFQDTSDLSKGRISEFTELWYEQKTFDGKLRAKIGKIDVSTEFAQPANAAEFLNSSMGHSPTILSFPEGIETAFGGNLFVYPTSNFHAGIGAYGGSPHSGNDTGASGPATLFATPTDAFLIGEADVTWSISPGCDGRLGAGVWHHTGTFDLYNGGVQHGATGPYLILDQTLWRQNPENEKVTRGISMYLQYGYANPAISQANHHVGAGLVWAGPIPRRDDDQFGLGLSMVRFTDAAGAHLSFDDEVAIESYYKIRASKWLSIKPDLQFITHPGGASGASNALAFTLQLVADF